MGLQLVQPADRPEKWRAPVEEGSIAGVGFFGRHWSVEEAWARLAQSYIEPGEQIDHLLMGSRPSLMPSWLLVITERAIVVIEVHTKVVQPFRISGAVRPFRDVPRVVLPRRTRLGPVHRYGWIVVDGERLHIGVGKRAKIAAIDAEAGFPG